jgi:hypothetical protein
VGGVAFDAVNIEIVACTRAETPERLASYLESIDRTAVR